MASEGGLRKSGYKEEFLLHFFKRLENSVENGRVADFSRRHTDETASVPFPQRRSAAAGEAETRGERLRKGFCSYEQHCW